MPTLAQYITETRRLLHDATGRYWDDPELTDYINDGRNHLVGDTGCNRILQATTLTQGNELYPYSGFPKKESTIDILNVTLLWGNSRIILGQMSFSEFNPKFRTYQNLQSRPVVFAKYGQTSIYIGPVPDQTYQAELDTVCLPDPLVNPTDVDVLVYPYTTPVSFFAAYKAKHKEQSYVEAQTFYQDYVRECKMSIVQTLTRSIPSLYSSS